MGDKLFFDLECLDLKVRWRETQCITQPAENPVSDKISILGSENNVSKNKVSFLSPIAKVLLNKKVGDVIVLQAPKGERSMKILAVEY